MNFKLPALAVRTSLEVAFCVGVASCSTVKRVNHKFSNFKHRVALFP